MCADAPFSPSFFSIAVGCWCCCGRVLLWGRLPGLLLVGRGLMGVFGELCDDRLGFGGGPLPEK